MELGDDNLVDPADGAIEERPRRLHGSARLGPDPVFPEPHKTFTLRPCLDELPEEQSLRIEINGRPVAALVCSPTGAAELAVGWAFAQGFVDDFAQIQRITPYRDRVALMIERPGPGGASWQGLVVSGFDASTVQSPRLPAAAVDAGEKAGELTSNAIRFDRLRFLAIIERAFNRFRDERGGEAFHHAALTDGDQICAVARDVSRHNAVDKLVGWSLTHAVDRTCLVLCLSGRISVDVAFKAWRAGFPIVASRSLPTCEAVELAHAGRITLVGRALEPQRAIYSHPWRLMVDDDES